MIFHKPGEKREKKKVKTEDFMVIFSTVLHNYVTIQLNEVFVNNLLNVDGKLGSVHIICELKKIMRLLRKVMTVT